MFTLFRYREAAPVVDVPLLLHIPANVQTTDELFDLYAQGLSFPSYFGRNWDAFWDCLTDLEWLPYTVIILVHDGIPLKESDRAIYIAMLDEWQGAFVFPRLRE